MRGLEDNVTSMEGRFRGPDTAATDPETRRKTASGFSFAIGMRPTLPDQTNDNVVDMEYYAPLKSRPRRMGKGALDVVTIHTPHLATAPVEPLAKVLAPTKADYFRLHILFPREAELLSAQMLERAKRGDTSDQLMAQFALYTYGMQQSPELHPETPLHPRPELHIVPDVPDSSDVVL